MTAPAMTIQRVHWLTLLKQRGELVTYSTGVVTIAELNVVMTRPGEDQVDLSEGMTLQSKQWDFLIDPATLIHEGDQIIPLQGHKITRANGTVYRVEPGQSSRNCWRWSEAMHTWRRVHTVIERDI